MFIVTNFKDNIYWIKNLYRVIYLREDKKNYFIIFIPDYSTGFIILKHSCPLKNVGNEKNYCFN